MKIFVIEGKCGEYDDYRECIVKAFRNEKSGQKYVDKLNKWVSK
jgi:hypothetical protein